MGQFNDTFSSVGILTRAANECKTNSDINNINQVDAAYMMKKKTQERSKSVRGSSVQTA